MTGFIATTIVSLQWRELVVRGRVDDVVDVVDTKTGSSRRSR